MTTFSHPPTGSHWHGVCWFSKAGRSVSARDLTASNCSLLLVLHMHTTIAVFFFSPLSVYLFNVYVCFACMCICAPLLCLVPVKPREDLRCPRTGIIDGCKLLCGLWIKTGFWKEQPALLATQPLSRSNTLSFLWGTNSISYVFVASTLLTQLSRSAWLPTEYPPVLHWRA